MKKLYFILMTFAFIIPSGIALAEISQEEQQRQAQKAYEAAAEDHNAVAGVVNKAIATVKKATSRNQAVRTPSSGASTAVRG